MRVLCVVYDLKLRGPQDYDDLIVALEELDSLHLQQSVWLVAAAASPTAVRDRLRAFIGPDDMLAVLPVEQNAGYDQIGLTDEAMTWVRDKLNVPTKRVGVLQPKPPKVRDTRFPR